MSLDDDSLDDELASLELLDELPSLDDDELLLLELLDSELDDECSEELELDEKELDDDDEIDELLLPDDNDEDDELDKLLDELKLLELDELLSHGSQQSSRTHSPCSTRVALWTVTCRFISLFSARHWTS